MNQTIYTIQAGKTGRTSTWTRTARVLSSRYKLDRREISRLEKDVHAHRIGNASHPVHETIQVFWNGVITLSDRQFAIMRDVLAEVLENDPWCNNANLPVAFGTISAYRPVLAAGLLQHNTDNKIRQKGQTGHLTLTPKGWSIIRAWSQEGQRVAKATLTNGFQE